MLPLERLERRALLSAVVTEVIPTLDLPEGGSTAIDLRPKFDDPQHPGTVTQFETSQGNILVELFDSRTPLTVANFLNYVNSGRYINTIFHRSVSNFVVQGGGYDRLGVHVEEFPPVPNEPGILNNSGTIAMAKLGNDPNSATSEWFFNLRDNTDLNTQNGGFTVFGQIISGDATLQAIANLQVVNISDVNRAWDHLPVQGQSSNGQVNNENFVLVNTITVTPKLSFAVSSDTPNLVNPTISSGVLSVNPVAGQSGIAHLSITATDLFGAETVQTVRVRVAASAPRTLDVPLSGNGQSVTWKQEDKETGTFSLFGPGSGVLRFSGDGLSVQGGRVRGANVQLETVNLTGTTSGSTMSIIGRGLKRGSARVGEVTVDGSLSKVALTKAVLLGDMTVSGGVGRLNIDFARSGAITVGARSRPQSTMEIKLNSWSDENLTSAAPLGLIRSFSWGNSDVVSEGLKAPSIDSVKALGSFSPGVVLAGDGTNKTLGRFRSFGPIGGVWSVPGKLPVLAVGSVAGDFDGTFDNPISVLNVRGSFSGLLTAPSIQSMKVGSFMRDAQLTLTAALDPKRKALGSLQVGQSITRSAILATGNIGSVKADNIGSAVIFAGVTPQVSGEIVPTAASEFTSASRIDSVTLHPSNKTVGFAGSGIAASSVGALSLGSTRVDNGGTTYGIAGRTIDSIKVRDIVSKKSITVKSVQDATALATQLAQVGLDLKDFKISVLS